MQPKCRRYIFDLRKIQWVPGIFRISFFVTSRLEKTISSPFPNPLLYYVHRLKLICKSRVILAVRKLQWFVYNAVESMSSQWWIPTFSSAFWSFLILITRWVLVCPKWEIWFLIIWVYLYRYFLLPLSFFMHLYHLHGFSFLLVFWLWVIYLKLSRGWC